MRLKEADQITQVYAKFLEHCFGRLNMLFYMGGNIGNIPESLLPYSKNKISNALETMKNYHLEKGDNSFTKAFEESWGALISFDNDEKTLKKAGEVFSDAKNRRIIIKSLKSWQKNFLETQE